MMKRKVVTYHSTISNDKLERELNEGEGYHLEFLIPHEHYETLVLVADKKEEHHFSWENEKIIDAKVICLENPDAEAEMHDLIENEGFEVKQATTKNVILIKKEIKE